MLPLAGNGERIKIFRFDLILEKKGRYSGLDLGTISERNQNGEIVSVNLGTLTNSQIVVSHTFIGDGERDSSGQNLVCHKSRAVSGQNLKSSPELEQHGPPLRATEFTLQLR